MFSLFKKKKRELPPFPDLAQSEWKGKYFTRIASWGWLNEDMIHVFDPNAPRMITMDPWLQLVFLAADGQHTVEDMVLGAASKYDRDEEIPAVLDQTILQVIGDLLQDRLIVLSNSPQVLPENIREPHT